METIINQPNAAKLLNSLRYTGYSSYDALADLVDNSLDAQATIVSVELKKKTEDIEITVTDNGYGMDADTLREAMKLGSDTYKDESSDLGKFGMGLVTGSLAIARRLEVLTKAKDNKASMAVQDLDLIAKTQDF